MELAFQLFWFNARFLPDGEPLQRISVEDFLGRRSKRPKPYSHLRCWNRFRVPMEVILGWSGATWTSGEVGREKVPVAKEGLAFHRCVVLANAADIVDVYVWMLSRGEGQRGMELFRLENGTV